MLVEDMEILEEFHSLNAFSCNLFTAQYESVDGGMAWRLNL